MNNTDPKPRTKADIENDIEDCILVVQDEETDRFTRAEFQQKLNQLRKELNKA